MAEIAFRNPDTVAPPLGAYSHVAAIPSGMRLLVLAGQVGRDVDGLVPDGAERQYELALRNLVRLLESEGATPADLVKLNTYLVQPMDFAKVRAIRESVLGPVAPPATLVYVAGLAGPEYLVEVDGWAARSS
jgi:enamine deaminase RidA (YjgF/YER057c/UK114 family)